ncbi:DUF4188 domain-containing protein [Sphaerisporangium sp. NPDC051011]|uniref:monooxygenase family protein n=1 Tax=Sphaerisporangium sp. NPDC051011 TaxID=3155792 RepID=UPI0033C98CB3
MADSPAVDMYRVNMYRLTVAGPPGTPRETTPVNGRHAAGTDGDVTLFLIGLRLNRWRSIGAGLRVVRAMLRLLAGLQGDHESGYRGHRILFGPSPREVMVLQYWAGEDRLRAFATDPGHRHREAWRMFEQMARSGDGVGLWHEIYRVPPGGASSFYRDTPPVGLAAVAGLTPKPRGRRVEAHT